MYREIVRPENLMDETWLREVAIYILKQNGISERTFSKFVIVDSSGKRMPRIQATIDKTRELPDKNRLQKACDEFYQFSGGVEIIIL